MRIAFYANHPMWGGLGNNGGSNTILRSAEALRQLGHKVDVVAKVDKFTYFKHPKPLPKLPKCDICIAVSIADIAPMVKECPKGVKMGVWIRGWSTWAMSSSKMLFYLKMFSRAGHLILTNSRWIEKYLEKKEIPSIQFVAGMDYHVWRMPAMKPERITIGTLYHKVHKTKGYKFWLKVKKMLGDQYDYVEIGRKPMNDRNLSSVYHKSHIWFSATTLEGWHNVPAEAGLCGAAIVCNDHPRNGMIMEYAYEKPLTAIIYKEGNVRSAYNAVKIAIENRNKLTANFIRFMEENIGSRKEETERLVHFYDNR